MHLLLVLTQSPITKLFGELSTIILVENDEITTNDKKNAEVMNEYIVNIKKKLNIPANMIEKLPDNIDLVQLRMIRGSALKTVSLSKEVRSLDWMRWELGIEDSA